METMEAEFTRLQQFLGEQKNLLQHQLEKVEEEIVRKGNEHLARLSEGLSSLGGLIQKMEQKCQQPLDELLQNVELVLQRKKKKRTFENPVAFLPELMWKIWDFCDINPFLKGVMKQFKDAMLPGLQLQKANITLDPDTAHVNLIVSEDRKSVAHGCEVQHLPDNPKRFANICAVLGNERFTTGRHFWEVVVGREEQWLAGVTIESLERKNGIDWNPKGDILAVGKWGGCYRTTAPSNSLSWPPSGSLKRIRVFLNCAAGQVAFYDADTAAHLLTFSEASFAGKTILPFFNVNGKGYICISP